MKHGGGYFFAGGGKGCHPLPPPPPPPEYYMCTTQPPPVYDVLFYNLGEKRPVSFQLRFAIFYDLTQQMTSDE